MVCVGNLFLRHFHTWKELGIKIPGFHLGPNAEEETETLDRMVDDTANAGDKNVVANDEILVRVAVYHHSRNIRMQEMVVLGSHPLTVLKDAIACESDRDELIDPANPCLGSFFFFGDTFFIDTRDQRNIDFSVYDSLVNIFES